MPRPLPRACSAGGGVNAALPRRPACTASCVGMWPRLRRTLLSLRHSDASTATTLRLFARNNWLKLRHLSLCCGNPGQPGC